MRYYFFLSTCLLGLLFSNTTLSQTIPAGFPVLEESLRRQQLLGAEEIKDFSFGLRPIVSLKQNRFNALDDTLPIKTSKVHLELLPVLSTTVFNSNRPYGWGNSSMMNSTGIQSLLSPGVYGKLFFLKFQFRPEFVASQNKAYQGFGENYSDNTLFARFRYWNFGDHPERFTKEYNSFAWWGQSYVSLNVGPVELGASTQNIWWGPGQFNSLIFSNNARGMKHLYLRTSRPANIFIGKLEAELIMGRAEDSGILPSQNERLNGIFARPFRGDWRYVSGITLTYQPVFLPNFFAGFSRTFQQYNEDVPNTFRGRIPVLEPFQKVKLFSNDNSVVYDSKGQDQQIAFFLRYFNSKGNFEAYAEFGKQDHSYDWRDFILSPEHARAYLLGFSKLFKTGKQDQYYQVRGEIVQQAESVNRYIRYPDLNSGNTSWHTHYQVRGFTNEGQSMGVGIGVGGNAQILEVSQVSNLNKVGILLQRIENHQDFYYRSFGNNPNKRPWIDFSMGILWDHQWDRFILSSKAQVIQGVNYQWENLAGSTSDFPKGQKLWTFSGTLNLIYQIHHKY
ncbi:capsule assembly Wzi family protein [Algoriphagus aquimarinus]|uniref:Capsule assembly Wzi family protein n=1 Tax=Algoriphagus aquimarinus TaxID=237018 RepID=A0A5C7ALM5_9BACT|nr:capsule assembly Wzi family protein [Algoriphagus aquimarinus]TXE08814.1 capsule assembly Wzi family protein [Algoriphagus aquimarinus]